MEVQEAAALLRACGVRVTASRLAVLRALHDLPHTDVDALTQAGVRRLGSLSKQAVYDILGTFVRTGLARRIQPAGGPARFETRTGDNHHHLVCRTCGRTVDVDCAVGVAPCLEPSTAEAFVVDEVEVTFWGLCPTCQGGPEWPANQ